MLKMLLVFPCILRRAVAHREWKGSETDLPMQLKDNSCRQNREQPSPLILFMSSHSSPRSLQAGHKRAKRSQMANGIIPMIAVTPLQNPKALKSSTAALWANPENSSPFLLQPWLSSFLVHKLAFAWPLLSCTCGYHLLFSDEDMSNFLHSWCGCNSAGGEKENSNLWNPLY